MNLEWLPRLYFLAFLATSVGWRTYRVWQLSGVNALTTFRKQTFGPPHTATTPKPCGGGYSNPMAVGWPWE